MGAMPHYVHLARFYTTILSAQSIVRQQETASIELCLNCHLQMQEVRTQNSLMAEHAEHKGKKI